MKIILNIIFFPISRHFPFSPTPWGFGRWWHRRPCRSCWVSRSWPWDCNTELTCTGDVSMAIDVCNWFLWFKLSKISRLFETSEVLFFVSFKQFCVVPGQSTLNLVQEAPRNSIEPVAFFILARGQRGINIRGNDVCVARDLRPSRRCYVGSDSSKGRVRNVPETGSAGQGWSPGPLRS